MNELVTQPKGGFSSQLRAIHSGLVNARNDQERERIRDIAKAIENAAEILKMKSIQVEASFLVMDAERDISKANPPNMGGKGTPEGSCVPPGNATQIPQTQVRKIRMAHDNISDTEYSEIKSEAADNEEPLKRSKLQEIIKDKKLNKSKSDKDKQKAELEKNRIVELPADKYQTVVIDPPWNVERVLLPSHNDAAFPYQQMTLDEIKSIKLPLADNAFVFLWTTHGYLRDSFSIIENDWGLEFVELLIWHKPNNNRPFANRPMINSEFIIMCKKGKPELSSVKGFLTCFSWERNGVKHSEKPDGFYDMIRGITPEPRVDMFGRRKIEGFDSWGNESQ